MSPEQWDTRYWPIFNDLLDDGVDEDEARAIAEFECAVQFGDRPAEETT